MSLFSFGFLACLAIVFFTYYIVPIKYRYIVLLVASYAFYTAYDIRYTAVLVCVTLITYFSAYFMKKQKKLCLWTGLLLCIGILLFFRFYRFFEVTKSWDIVMPLGLSFYLLQAMSYMIDVYKGKTEIITNFLQYSLYVSFFPTILSGPIERSTNLLPQIRKGAEFDYDLVKEGIVWMLWGYALKLLISNRFALIVNPIFSDIANQTGLTILFGLLFYGIQLYADFSGYSYIARGLGRVFGFKLVENFRQPYFTKNINEFWSRWHMSLSNWLRDYVYFSLGGSRCSKQRVYLNLFLTMIISGLWHGTGWTYLFWGMLHGVYQVIHRVKVDLFGKKEIVGKFNNILAMIATTALFMFTQLFFRVEKLSDGFVAIRNIFINFDIGNTLYTKSFLMGYSPLRFVLLLAEVVILWIVDIIHNKNMTISGILSTKKIYVRWSVYMLLIVCILIGVVYDYGSNAATFIYAQF